MAIERVSLINSNFTTLVSDSDYSKYEVWLTDGQGGVMFSNVSTKPDFALTGTTNPDIAAGNAIIVATRATSTPIVNQKVALRYELSATKSFSGAVNGSKIFIRVNQTLINDPTLIEDTFPSTDFALGRNIGVMEMAGSYPSDPHIALWEYDGAVWTDVREMPVINGNKVDMGALTQNIVTTGDIQGDDITASGDVTGDRLFQDTYKAPTVDNELTPKLYVDGQILSASSVEALVDKDTYFLGEDADAGDSVFVEDMVTFDSATQVQAIGDVTGNTRVSIPAFGSGTASNTLKLALRKYVSPSVNLGVRIETDNAGEPSGTLFDADATSTVTEASLTTSLVDTTVTLADTITIPLGQKVWIVLFAGTYGSETINGTNYFGVGYAQRNTTTRRLTTYDGIDWKDLEALLATDSRSGGTSQGNISGARTLTVIPNKIITLQQLRLNDTPSSSSCVLTGGGLNITVSSVSHTFTFNNEILYPGITYTFSWSNINHTWYSPMTNNFVNFSSFGGSNNFRFQIDSTYLLKEDNFPYLSSSLFTPILLSKTDATYTYKLPTDLPRIATETKTAGQNCITTTFGLNDNFSGLTPLADYYIVNTPGAISITPGSNLYMIGQAITDEILDVGTYNGELTITNNISYYTANRLIATITVSAPNNNQTQGCTIQISDDNSTWTTIADQTNEIGPNGTRLSATAPIPKNKYFRLNKDGGGNGTPRCTVLSL